MERSAYGRDGIGLDIILGALLRQCLGEANETHLCRAVIGLTKIT